MSDIIGLVFVKEVGRTAVEVVGCLGFDDVGVDAGWSSQFNQFKSISCCCFEIWSEKEKGYVR